MNDSGDLLDGLEGEARAARERLLARLRADGFDEAELRQAAAEDRLALLPVERELRGEARYSAEELVADCGIDLVALKAVRRAAGLPVPSDDTAPAYSEGDRDAARRLKGVLDAGLPLEGLVDANRVMGRAVAQIAAAMRQLVAQAVLERGGTEDETAEGLVTAARTLMPSIGPTMEHFFAQHLLEMVHSDVLGAEQLAAGRIGAARETAVAFADLVGFTRLGGRVAPEDLGAVARRFETLAGDAVGNGVRIVKTIGDAVMLTSHEPDRLIASVLSLCDAVDAEGEGFPQVRCGIALGLAIERDGDLYGHAVNLASRVTGIARAGSVLTTEEVREAAEDGLRWSFAGERRVKGVGELKLFRVRWPEEGEPG